MFKLFESIFYYRVKKAKISCRRKAVIQGLNYKSFMESRIYNAYGVKVVCIIIGGRLSPKPTAKAMVNSFADLVGVYFKPYELVLGQAKTYHQEIIDRYNILKSNNNG